MKCYKINEDFLIVAFIFWLGLSVAITSAVAFFCFENRIDGDVDRLSGFTLNWYNQWLAGCAWACLAGGILAPAALLAPILHSHKCVAVTSTIAVWILLSTPAPVLLSRLVHHTEELLTGSTSQGLIRLKHQVLTDAEVGMKDTLIQYIRGDHLETESWNRFQKKFKCCGVFGNEDWHTAANSSFLPTSCCRMSYDSHFSVTYDCSHQHTKGCYTYVVGNIQKTVQNVSDLIHISFFLLSSWSVATLAATLPWLGVKITPKQIVFCNRVRRKTENGPDGGKTHDGRRVKVTFKED